MSDKIYRVAIIGCGGMGNGHARTYQNHPRTEVVAAMDIRPEAAKRLAEANSVPNVYTDRKEMFEKEELDIDDRGGPVCSSKVQADIT